jgi:DNA-binding transcriptional MerR regulator
MDKEHVETTYWAKEVADTLGIANSTLRKWCRLLEEGGYRFIRDQQERRAFTEHDVLMLRSFYELTQDKGVSLDSAVNLVISRFQREAIQDGSLPDTPHKSRDIERYEQIIERLNKQEQFNQALLERLDQQQAYIEQSISKRDETLLQAIREMQETRLQLAASQEKKPSFWRRLFSRKKE